MDIPTASSSPLAAVKSKVEEEAEEDWEDILVSVFELEAVPADNVCRTNALSLSGLFTEFERETCFFLAAGIG